MSRLPESSVFDRIIAGQKASEEMIGKCLTDKPGIDPETSQKIRDGANKVRGMVLETMAVFIIRCTVLGVDTKIAEEVARVALAAALAEMQKRHEMRSKE